MAELCNTKPAHFSTLSISDIIILFSTFILSHPLYFSYIIFFSPYLLKLVSFLSPLFVTTPLLLLIAYSSVVERLRSRKGCSDDEFDQWCLDVSGVVYEIFFGASVIGNEMESGDADRSSGGDGDNVVEENRVSVGEIGEENRGTVGELENNFGEIGEENRGTVGELENNFGEIGEENRCTGGILENNFGEIGEKNRGTVGEVENNCGEIGEENQVSVGEVKNNCGEIGGKNRVSAGELKNNCGEIGGKKRGTVGKLANNFAEIGEENRITVGKLLNNCGEMVEERRLENFLKILDEFEMSSNVEQINKKVAPLTGAKIDKAMERPKSTVKNVSDALGVVNDNIKFINGEKEPNSMAKSQSQSHGSSRDFDCSFSSYGSMRKEKEWKRTLACKLFEERHNVDGGDGMDSLWEAYEIDSDKSKAKNVDKSKKTKMKKTKKEVELYEEDEIVGQLCCLQALKLSTRKMNMGIGRPSLVKITNAIKGIGWLHHVSKKVHNNGDKDRY